MNPTHAQSLDLHVTIIPDLERTPAYDALIRRLLAPRPPTPPVPAPLPPPEPAPAPTLPPAASARRASPARERQVAS
jgi:hypothetical protein